MVIFKPHRGGLEEAMAEAVEFNSIDEMLSYICNDHNKYIPYFQIKSSDIYIEKSEYGDERIKWHNLFYLMYERRSKISDYEGLLKYFGIKDDPTLPDDERDIYVIEDNPIGVIGTFSTNYERIDRSIYD